MTQEALAGFDFENVTLEEMDNLSVDDLLGVNLADIDLTSALPDGLYIGFLTKKDVKKRAADPENNKKGGVSVNVSLKVVKCLQCAESDIDKSTLANRMHFQQFPWHIDMGPINMAKLVLGILGISYKDKAAIAEVGGALGALLGQLIDEKVAFGFTIKNRESGGYENCDIVFKEAAFIAADKVAEYLD